MAKAPNFTSLLDKPADSIERPKPWPEGPWLCVVKGLPRYDKSTKKQTEYVEFTLQPVEPLEEVEVDGYDYKDKTVKATFYITDGALFMLTDFLSACGNDLEGKSVRDAIEETPNQQVIAYASHRPSEDGSRVFTEWRKFAPVA